MKMMTMAMLAVVVLGFTACSDDDDKETTNYYSMGFSQTEYSYIGSGSALTAITNVMSAIEDPYKEALKSYYNDKGMIVCGSDSKIKEACEAAEQQIDINWGNVEGTFVFQVTNYNSNKVIYSKTFTNK